ncbi:hypothetical protein QUF72_04700 [Desulfobacterales bacterium HSG2]|nr:hypothetical protein [Desulfobacterales bacterium HSG2]
MDNYAPFSEKIRMLYTAMDQKYKAVADYYGFHCTGCRENCCLTRFYHHTFSEYFYLLEGYKTLTSEKRATVKEIAREVCRKMTDADKKGQTARFMCPLNSDGLCLLYAYRPMICRLHGIPSELRRPGQNAAYSPGCEAFTAECGGKDYFKFDRTPFYVEMAGMEAELRRVTGISQKLRMTVAEMLTSEKFDGQ